MSEKKNLKPKHDEVVRGAFENPIVAKEFFETYLPPHIQTSLSFDTLKMEKDSFVDKGLKKSILDILFSAKFGDKNGYLLLLLEHQSTPDPNMPLRLFKYMLKVAEYYKKATKSKKLPFIYPLIFYNGKKKYNAPRNIWELFENSELVKNSWSNDCKIIDVQDVPDEQLKEKAWAGILQFFMKHIHKRNLLEEWYKIADLLPKIAEINFGIDYIELILSYTLPKIKEDDKIGLEKMLKSRLNPELGEKLMGSLAYSWKQEGIQEGIHITEMKLEAKLKEEKSTLAKKMLAIKEPIEKIIDFTDLTKEEIEKLKP